MAYEPAGQPANPFQSPSVDAGDDLLSSGPTAEALRRTRPWVLFLAVLGAIGIAFMTLGMIGMGISAAVGPLGGSFVAVMMIFYFAMIVGYAFPVVYMFKYAGRIRAFQSGGAPNQLSHAMEAQRLIWKSMGIFVLVGLALYVLMIIAVLTGGLILDPVQQPNVNAPPPVQAPPMQGP